MTKYINPETVIIGLPVYNGEKIISGALDSLLNQSYRNLKIIISDNSSTDKTSDICQAYADKDERIVFIRQEWNIGQVPNFIFVRARAQADCGNHDGYFMWAAADDRWHPDFIQSSVTVMKEDPGASLVFSGVTIRDLRSGHESNFFPSQFGMRNKFVRYLFRIFSTNSNAMYGLQRLTRETGNNFLNFDYQDLYFVRWNELRGGVRIIPRFLFITGTDGKRMPYSLTGEKISYWRFIRAEYRMLRREFSWSAALTLSAVSLFMCAMTVPKNVIVRKEQWAR